MDIVTTTSLPRVAATGVTSNEVHTITAWPPSTILALAGTAKEATEKKEEHHYYLDRVILCMEYIPSLSLIATEVILFNMVRLGPGVVRDSRMVNSSSPSTMLSSIAKSVVHTCALSAEPGSKVRGIKGITKSAPVAGMCKVYVNSYMVLS